jgi:hypothetical protein
MKISNLRKKRQTGPLSATASLGSSSAVQLGRAIQGMTEHEPGAFVFSARKGVFEVRPIGSGTKFKPAFVSMNSVRIEKALKVGKRLAKDARFSRATQLLRQDESSETTASIAQNFNDTLERNKDFYDRLLFNLKR